MLFQVHIPLAQIPENVLNCHYALKPEGDEKTTRVYVSKKILSDIEQPRENAGKDAKEEYEVCLEANTSSRAVNEHGWITRHNPLWLCDDVTDKCMVFRVETSRLSCFSA